MIEYRIPQAIVVHGAGRSSRDPSARRVAPADTDVVRVPEPWRLIATMNVFDRDLLYRLSYALMRRFAFIEVESRSDDVIRELIRGPSEVVGGLLPVRELVDLCPALFVDSAHFAARLVQDRDATPSRVLYEVFHAYFLPQLDQLDDLGARRLYDLISPSFDTEEQSSVQLTVTGFACTRPRTGSAQARGSL